MEKQDFILKEDNNIEHDKTKNRNIVRQWKEENNLEYFFNYVSSLDLFFIGNC